MRKIAFAAGVALAVALAFADHDRVATTDYAVKVGGEQFKDVPVAMSCRFGALAAVGHFTELLTDDSAVLFRTEKHGLPVYLLKNNPDLVGAARKLEAKEEITVLGVVRWSQPTGPYVLAAQVQKGFSCGYDENAGVEAVTIHVSQCAVRVELGQVQGIACPHCQNQLLVSWEK